MPKQTRSKMVVKNFRISERTWADVEAWCVANDQNYSDFMRAAVEEKLARNTT